MSRAKHVLGVMCGVAGLIAGGLFFADGQVGLGCAWMSLGSLWIVFEIETSR